MRTLTLLLALSVAVLLVSGPSIRAARAEEDEFEGLEMDENFAGEGDDISPSDIEGFEMDTDEGNDIPDGDDGDVVGLTEETLKQKVEEGKPFLLEFYAPWCGHCKALAPAFKEAATALKEYGVVVAKVDATKAENIAAEYGVEGYPSILWVVGKKIKQYNGGRSSSDIVTWVKKKIGFAVATLASAEDAKEALEKSTPLAAGFFKDLKGKEAEAFLESGKEGDGVNFYQTDKADVAKALGLPSDVDAAVAVIKDEDEKFVLYDGPFAADNITEFVLANRLPLLISFSDETAQLIFGGNVKKMLFLFFPDSEYATLSGAFLPIAKENKGKVIFIYINGSDPEQDNVREFFGAEGDQKLAIGFSTERREDGEKFQMEKELTPENLKEFVAEYVSGNAKPFFKSEPIPEKNDGPVTVVVGKSFESVVLDGTKDVLFEVYAPWCGHCKALEPVFNKLGEKFAGIESVVIAKMDGTANEHPDVKVEGFPTLLFYPAKDKSSPITVDAERKVGAFAEFIKEHASIPFELPSIGPEDEVAEPEEGEEDFSGEDSELEEFPEDDIPEDDLSQKDEL